MIRFRKKQSEAPQDQPQEAAAHAGGADETVKEAAAEQPVDSGVSPTAAADEDSTASEEAAVAAEAISEGGAAGTSRDEIDEIFDAVKAEVEQEAELEEALAEEEEERPLSLEVQITESSACERHIVVTIPREEIERYFQREFDELAETATVPGFRPGRAPRKLIERRFRKSVAESVKLALVYDAIEQVNEQYKLVPIGEPRFEMDAIVLPDDGPLTFEYDLEVRPRFELPEWRGMQLERWKVEVTHEEIEREVHQHLESLGSLEPYDGPAELGDYVVVDLKFTRGDQVIAESSGEVIRIKRVLRFLDADIPGFDELMRGVRAGDVRQCTVQVSPYSADVSLRGAEVQATFTVREVRRPRVPELTPEVLERLGVSSGEELREIIREMLTAQKIYLSRRHLRRQITAILLKDANWELPPSLVARQAQRELRRTILELQDSGMPRSEIQKLYPTLVNDAVRNTADALREHFIFEGIAEQLGITVSEAEVYEAIRDLAHREGISPRRLRARLEQQGGLDAVVNMVLESKVLDAILKEAQITEVPMPESVDEEERLTRSIGEMPPELVSQVDRMEV